MTTLTIEIRERPELIKWDDLSKEEKPIAYGIGGEFYFRTTLEALEAIRCNRISKFQFDLAEIDKQIQEEMTKQKGGE